MGQHRQRQFTIDLESAKMVKTIISITGDYYHEGKDTDQCLQRVLSLLDEPVIYEMSL